MADPSGNSKTAEEKAQVELDEEKAPDAPGENFDHKAFLTAMFENDWVLPTPQNAVSNVESYAPSDSNSDKEGDENNSGQPSSPRAKVDATTVTIKLPPKLPGDGSFNFLCYIPEWSDPDFEDGYEQGPGENGALWKRANVDALTWLRPALRGTDAGRLPTDYAKRWGIFPGRTDGRSRLSPTFAATRKARGDHGNLVVSLDDEVRTVLVERTKSLLLEGETRFEGRGILPEVYEELRSIHRVPPVEKLKTNPTRFEESIEAQPYVVKELYRSFVENNLDDQDYQRLIFNDLTTDEVISQNVHTMSNAERCDLYGPLYELFEKDHWEDTLYRGAVREFPRFVYQIGSSRMEYDVHRNLYLWEAIQPALQMASRVVKSNPSFIESLFELRTRQNLNNELDPRDEAIKESEHLERMVPVEKIDMSECNPIIQSIDFTNVDFKEMIMSILRQRLEIRITGGRYSAWDGEMHHFTYGETYTVQCDEDTTISIALSAELIWPLLTPAFSSSEKLSVSFMLAVTLLHEFMHAIHKAIILLCFDNENKVTDAQCPSSLRILFETYGGEYIDRRWGGGEPIWKNDIYAELGHAFESETFGRGFSSLTDHGGSTAEMLQGIALALVGQRHPMPWKTARSLGADLLSCHSGFPVESYEQPMPVDYYSRFFAQGFWDETFAKFGHGAFKLLPPDRTLFTTMIPDYLSKRHGQNCFADGKWAFMTWFWGRLNKGGHSILAWYLRAAAREYLGASILYKRWMSEAKTWDHQDKAVHAVVDEFYEKTLEADNISAYVRDNNPEVAYTRWLAVNTKCTLDYAEWYTWIQKRWHEMFEEGGELITMIAELHRLLQFEASIMERFVFEFLNIPQSQRSHAYTQTSFINPIERMEWRTNKYHRQAMCVEEVIVKVLKIPQLVAVHHIWNHWLFLVQKTRTIIDNLNTYICNERSIDDKLSQAYRLQLLSVPTAQRKSRTKILYKLAVKEYMRLDPRIRAGVDIVMGYMERDAKIRKFPVPTPINDEVLTKKLAEIETTVRTTKSDPANKVNNIFAYQRSSKPGSVDRKSVRSLIKPHSAAETSASPSTPVFDKSLNVLSSLKCRPPQRRGRPVGVTTSSPGAAKPSVSKAFLQWASYTGPGFGKVPQKFREDIGDSHTIYNRGPDCTLSGTVVEGSPPGEGGAPVVPMKAVPNGFMPTLSVDSSGSGFTAPVAPMEASMHAIGGLPLSAPLMFPHPYAQRITLTQDLSNIVSQTPLDIEGAIRAVREGPGGMAFRERPIDDEEEE